MDGEFAYDESGINRFTYKLAAVCIVVGGLFWIGTRPTPQTIFCPADGLILDDGRGEARRDPEQGCRWVYGNGDLVYECPGGSPECTWSEELGW